MNLIYDDEKKILHTKNNEALYTLTNKVPVILIQESSPVSSQLHQNVKSGFAYADHYQKDAEVYDYFSGNEISATKKEIERLHETIIKKCS